MFNISKLILFNFKSYKGKHGISFSVEPGLYFIVGVSDLDGNGAGKSTILDAIVWCLFGSTPKGEKAADIITRGQKTSWVDLCFTVGDRELHLLRQQSPNSLILNGKHVTQDDLEKVIRLNKSSFLYSVIAPQGGQSFFKRSPTEKLSLFSQIMGLEFWMEKSKEAAEEVSHFDLEIAKLQSSLEASRLVLKSVDDEITDLTEKSNRFKDESRKTVSLLEDKITTLKADVAKKDERIQKLDEMIGFWLTELKTKEDNLKKQREARDGHLQKQTDRDHEWRLLDGALKQAQQATHALESLGATCPTCNQPITGGHLKAEKGKTNKEVVRLTQELAVARKAYTTAHSFTDKINKDIDEAKGIINSIEDDLREWEKRADGLDAEMKHHRGEIIRLESEIITEKARTNPYLGLIKSKREAASKATATLKGSQKELDDLVSTQDAISYWVTGFKRVRLYLIDETLRALEIEVNNCLTSLGLIDWSIEFDVERENKSGGVTKGFTVLIREPSYPDPIKFESWSGGESQRLQLAGDLGMANLIMTQAGLVNTIEFFDEPSNYLSPGGLSDLAETLQQRAVSEGKRIFLIDHHTYEFGEFAGTFTVTKDKDGSHFDVG